MLTNPVFLISSCLKDETNGANDALRKTWIPRVRALGYDVFFCIGDYSPAAELLEKNFDPELLKSPPTLGAMSHAHTKRLESPPDKSKFPGDILWLPCPDGYVFLPWKTQQSLAWALEQGYSASVRCFTDTYIFAEKYDRLLREKPWERYDCTGHMFRNPIDLIADAPFGGPSYILSRGAMERIAAAKITSWAEDCWVGIVMREEKMLMYHDSRFHGFWIQPGLSWHQPWGFNSVSAHLNDRAKQWDPQKLVKVHTWYMALAPEERDFTGICQKCGSTKFARSFVVRCKQCGYPLASSVRDSKHSVIGDGLVLDRDDLLKVRPEPLRQSAV
jgi:ribosomal protein L37E